MYILQTHQSQFSRLGTQYPLLPCCFSWRVFGCGSSLSGVSWSILLLYISITIHRQISLSKSGVSKKGIGAVKLKTQEIHM